MEENQDKLFSALLPSVAARMRSLLANIHSASMALASPEARDQDMDMDRKAAWLDQSYYQLLQMAMELNTVGQLMRGQALPMKDGDLVSLIRQMCTESEGPAKVLGLQLQFVCAMPVCICGFSQTAIENLFYQLLSNAFKFTPAGGSVTVELRKTGRHILLTVRDTGCGIDNSHLEMLFERYRSGTVIEPLPHGLGLGLLICRKVAEGHGGTIVAKSELGVGSEFTLSIPERRVGGGSVSDVPMDYAGGFNPTLLALADSLPAEAFLQRQSE